MASTGRGLFRVPWSVGFRSLYVIGTLLTLLASILLSRQGEARDELALGFARPLISALLWIGDLAIPLVAQSYWYSGSAVALLLLVLFVVALWSRSGDRMSSFWLLAVLTSLLGHLCLMTGSLTAGALLYVAGMSVVVAIRGSLVVNQGQVDLSVTMERLLLVGLTLATVLFRFFGLNRIPSTSEREVIAHIAISSNLLKSIPVALGVADFPVISQGLLWQVVHHFATEILGHSLLSLRLLYASVGVLTVLVFYGFLRQACGARVALIGAALLSFAPAEMGWSRNEYFFDLSQCFVIGMCWITYRACTTGSRRTWLLLTALMGLSVFLYPSAMLSFGVPAGVALWQYLFDKNEGPSLRRAHAVMLAAGVALWVVLPSLVNAVAQGSLTWVAPHQAHYLNGGNIFRRIGETGPLTTAAFVADVVRMSLANTQEFAREVFVQAHPKLGIELASLWPTTLLPGVLLPFVPLGLVLVAAGRGRSVMTPVVLCWLGVTLIPGAMSFEYASRRFCGTLPALILLGAVGMDRTLVIGQTILGRLRGVAVVPSLMAVLAVSFQGVVQIKTYLEQHPPGVDPSTAVANEARRHLGRSSLVVLGLARNAWFPSQVFFQLLDDLENAPHPVAIIDANAESVQLPRLIEAPRPDRGSWIYRFTALDSRVPEAGDGVCTWVPTYLLRNDGSFGAEIERLRALHGRVETLSVCTDPAYCNLLLVKGSAADRGCAVSAAPSD